jgi:ketosteroid isomerase-like protein
MRLMLATTLVVVTLHAPAAAQPADDAINTVYAQLKASRLQGSIPGMTAHFAPEALLIDSRPGPALRGSELAERLAPQVERLAREGGRVETQYRIERRSVSGDVAVDAGFMRMAVVRPGAEPMVRIARFMVTMRRGNDGQWRIIGDAAMPATEAAWGALTPVAGLHFDA